MKLLVCMLIGHNPYNQQDAVDFFAGKQTICPRCDQPRFPCHPKIRSPFETLSHAAPIEKTVHTGDCYAGNCFQCKAEGKA